MKPLIVNITNKRSHLSALRTYEIECISWGSRPEAVITWWKGAHQVKHMARNVSISFANGRLLRLTYRKRWHLRRRGFWVLRSSQIIRTSREVCWVTCRPSRTMESFWRAERKIPWYLTVPWRISGFWWYFVSNNLSNTYRERYITVNYN